MSVLNIEDALLLIIDIQEKLLNAVYNKYELKKNIEIISKTAKILNLPCFVTEQYPAGLGGTISEIKSILSDSQYFEKTEFNALNNADLLIELKNTGKKQVILTGVETHICVRQTANALLNEGFYVSIAKDACGSRSEFENNAGLDIMKQEGADIKTVEIILFELLKTAKHSNFKEIQSLIK